MRFLKGAEWEIGRKRFGWSDLSSIPDRALSL